MLLTHTYIHTYILWTPNQLFKKKNCGEKKRYSLTPYVLSLPYGLFKNSFFLIALTCNMQESLTQQSACLPARECQVVFFHRDSRQQQKSFYSSIANDLQQWPDKFPLFVHKGTLSSFVHALLKNFFPFIWYDNSSLSSQLMNKSPFSPLSLSLHPQKDNWFCLIVVGPKEFVASL